MNFVSYAQLVTDVLAWGEQLPHDIDAFVGVPRSGMLVANILALTRNRTLADVQGFKNLRLMQGGMRDQHQCLKKVMIVDDSILTGKSLRRAAKVLEKMSKQIEIIYGGVYHQPGDGHKYLTYRQLSIPRAFEWNIYHGYWMQYACVDIDGVLCRDPTRAENDDGVQYRKFLSTVLPRHRPTVALNTIVTSRLERYRMNTESWLGKWGIIYKTLVMHPAATAKERRELGDHAERKANIYAHGPYRLFIESSARQAKEIFQLTKKPVYCADTTCLLS